MARNKAPSLALEPAQEQAALLMLQRFLDERFELQLGTFEVQEILDQITRELAPVSYTHLDVYKRQAGANMKKACM